MPADMAPMMVPIRAMATVRPNCRGVRPNLSVKECVVPAMTAVSNPNKSPPKAPTAVAFNSVAFNFITCLLLVYLTRVKAITKRRDCSCESAQSMCTNRQNDAGIQENMRQQSLFAVREIPEGLTFQPDFLSVQEERDLF